MSASKSVIAKCVVLTIVLTASLAAAAQLKPLEELKPPIDKVIAILNDSKYKTDDSLKSQQREEIWQTVEKVFDFEEVSKRAVARNWSDFSSTEKKDFVDVFGRFLGNTYMDKIQGEYHNEKIEYGSEEIVDGKFAMVRTKIKRETVEIPVDYKMKISDGRWRIYDVVIEGVSLVKNYRIQFASILKKETPAQLIERLRKKQIASE